MTRNSQIPKRQGGDKASLAHLITSLIDGKKPVDWEHEKVGIQYDGKQITLPAEPGKMPISEAIKSLEQLQRDEEQETSVDERIMAYPLEAAVAFVQAMEYLYGWSSPVPTPTFFGPIPPKMLSVQTGPGSTDFVQVPWGSFKIPGVENLVQTMADMTDSGQMHLRIVGTVRKREKEVLLELARVTRDILKEKSIYRGKAIHISTNAENKLDINNPPTFLDLRNVDPNELIMNRDVEEQIRVNILSLITHTEKVRAARIPLKRGVLLEGRYGVGKTMTTRMVAKLCIDNGWTFITVDRGGSLAEALAFARRYQPCVVFCEDIDRTTSSRDEGANDLLNTIDGIVLKNDDIMTVLTTNHVEKIEPAMLRPGRLDAVITVAAPDPESVDRLIRLYARGLLSKDADLGPVSKKLEGNIASTIREVVERSKLAMIAHENDHITGDDLMAAAVAMQAHMKLLEKKPNEPNIYEAAGMALSGLMEEAVFGGVAEDGAEKKTVGQLETIKGELRRGFGSIKEVIQSSFGGVKKIDKQLEVIKDRTDFIARKVS